MSQDLQERLRLAPDCYQMILVALETMTWENAPHGLKEIFLSIEPEIVKVREKLSETELNFLRGLYDNRVL